MEVKIIPATLTRPLRHRVLWPHIVHEEDCVIDIDEREDAVHLGVYDGAELVSIGSLFRMHSDKIAHAKQYRLRAMATDPKLRKAGAGRLLIQKACEECKARGAEVLWCDAREVALGFYAKLGFEMIDEWYEVRNIGPHKFMYREL